MLRDCFEVLTIGGNDIWEKTYAKANGTHNDHRDQIQQSRFEPLTESRASIEVAVPIL